MHVAWYTAYINTRHWRELRLSVFKQCGWCCEICGKQYGHKNQNPHDQLICHHLTYERLGSELLSDLAALCSVCHFLVHRDPEMPIAGISIIRNPNPPESVLKILHTQSKYLKKLTPLRRVVARVRGGSGFWLETFDCGHSGEYRDSKRPGNRERRRCAKCA